MSSLESLLARIPACTAGLRVLTRPSKISGCPVTSDTSVTSIPASLSFEAVPPVETIPATLAENGGGEPLDRVLELRATSLGESPVGISQEGKTWRVVGVWHPRSVIENSLESATETATGMLRIDQVISARGE